jgi:hypothetical protein
VTPLPTTVAELESTLVGIFPTFAAELAAVADDPPELGERTLHSVFFEFAPYFSRHVDSFSDKQLEKFGKLLHAALQTNGQLENALSTCFLEHVRQLKVSKQVRRLLRKAARSS